MKKSLLFLFFGLLTTLNYAQDNNAIGTEKIWRVNFLNLAIELEIPTGQFSTFSSALGIGYVVGILI